MDKEQFYATPPALANKLVAMVKKSDGMILEPSAGEGSLIDAYRNVHCPYYRQDSLHVHCIEINEKRAAILKDKNYKVVWDNFLSFDTLMPYQTILMNPPFNEGAKHLLKALQICAAGGEIACILNAETLKNPYTNERKTLLRELEAQENYKVEYIENAFVDADRSTNVEVALIYVKKQEADSNCITLKHFQKFFVNQYKQTENTALMSNDEIKALIEMHHAEVAAALALFDEIQSYNEMSLKGNEYDKGIFDIKIKSDVSDNPNPHVAIVRSINYKYWRRLFTVNDILRFMTSDVKGEYFSKLNEMADFEFNERNILQLKEDLSKNFLQNIDKAIMKIFDQFTHKYSFEKNSPNIHYYNGWKTNKAFKCNKKVILPLNAFSCYPFNGEKKYEFNSYLIDAHLSDIEMAMNYLDNGYTYYDCGDIKLRLSNAEKYGITKNIDTKYFILTLHKKGTTHLVFKDMELLKKLNIYAGRKFNWLPPSYSNKHYDAMDDEEKAVIDSFEGKKAYEKTYAKRDFYITDGNPNNNLLMLNAAS